MRVLIDGDSVAITTDDYTNLHDSKVVWTDIDPSSLADLVSLEQSAREERGMSEERKLQFWRLDTREMVGDEVDITGQSDRNVEKIMLGMLRNMHEDLYVHDTASTRERSAE